MSDHEQPKPFLHSAMGGIFVVIATVVVVGGIFVWALIQGAHH